MKNIVNGKTLARLGGVAAVVALDQLAKQLARSLLARGQSVEVIPGFFNLTLVFNQGAAWGMLSGFRYGFIALALAMLAFIALRHDAIFGTGRLGSAASILLCGGIVGNLIDRVFRGYVIDMFDFHWGPHHFPCFNLADTLICVSVGLLVLASFAAPRRETPPS